ncbi:hypothetical protein pb186bvf_012332 [Paramecium bursaria]
MRFLFCGDSNCPEWFLAESALLTKIASVKVKLVTQYIIQSLVDGEDLSSKIFKMLEGSGFNQQEINSTISCITFIIENSSKYDISDTVLTKELIDLGLPKENCEQISKTFKQFKERLAEYYKSLVFKVGKMQEMHYGVSKFIVSDNIVPQRQINKNRFVDVNIKYKDEKAQVHAAQFIIFPDQIEAMLNSFKKAQKIMSQY